MLTFRSPCYVPVSPLHTTYLHNLYIAELHVDGVNPIRIVLYKLMVWFVLLKCIFFISVFH